MTSKKHNVFISRLRKSGRYELGRIQTKNKYYGKGSVPFIKKMP